MRNLTHQAFKLGAWYAKTAKAGNVPEEICPESELSTVHEQLENSGYITIARTLAGPSINIAHKCRTLVEGRALRKYRKDEIALRVLDWVDEHPDSPTAIHELVDTLGRDFTGDFTREELLSVGQRLVEGEYVKGITASGGAVIRPKLTQKGERCLDSGYAPNDFESQDGGSRVTNYEANISGNVGGLQQGNHNEMGVTQRNEISHLLERMRELVPEDSNEAAEYMEAIESQAKSGLKRPSPLRALVTAFATSVGTATGQQVTELGEQLISVIQNS